MSVEEKENEDTECRKYKQREQTNYVYHARNKTYFYISFYQCSLISISVEIETNSLFISF